MDQGHETCVEDDGKPVIVGKTHMRLVLSLYDMTNDTHEMEVGALSSLCQHACELLMIAAAAAIVNKSRLLPLSRFASR